MIIIQPSILPGFMELLPEEQILFNDIKDKIESNFKKCGFWPLDTPAIEKDEILFAKGGGETTKQIFSIEKKDKSAGQSLRFDLTVPLARYVAQRAPDLAFPFKRYQISKVYRGERNQKGRYREFYQADIDIVGRDSLAIMNDAEIPALIYNIFKDLGIEDTRIHLNNRKLLTGFLQTIGIDDIEETIRLIDKIKKITTEDFFGEMDKLGLSKEQQEDLILFIKEGSNQDLLERLKVLEESLNSDQAASDLFLEGSREIRKVYRGMKAFGINEKNIVLDFSISRGLDYYTGTVYETFIEGYESIGSVASGGRYEDLASNFTKQKFPGVGISIGLTRLFYQLKQAGLIKKEDEKYIDALIIPMSENEEDAAIALTSDLRDKGLICQLYLEAGKMKKKFSYADSIKASHVIVLGESEIQEGLISIKNMADGQQEKVSKDKLIEMMKGIE